ncbi:hypothetical protein A1O7_06466 [Cladophialophora yegresii CBS 114405]|uniref:Uncharacterized protein n=1 Tax=Cladophialophora yegresii CBS 114405 TaxID=1182544 RepID=W9W219_9EURO|nr:uncharacterized protein A1O7_06466 [Cladophialophora yegresii CBS 114405]EXJ59035.1 hypothetical protein A1O7_06466 [Cladophialophora yegresii CBS 114405]
MQSSRYARLNPFGSSQPSASPIAEEPMHFSNPIPNSSYNPVPTSHVSDESLDSTSEKQRVTVQNRLISGTSGGLPYTRFDANADLRSPTNRRRTSSSLYKVAASIRDFAVSQFTVPSVAAPWEHELSEKNGASLPPSDSVRYFDHRRQRRRLFINSTFQWFVTAFICAALAGCLYGFSTVVSGLSTTRKYVFNALVTGLSLCLGLNLASSFRGYAQMMRWRFLASGYRTIQDFELIMNCDSQSKVFRLLWGGRTRGRWLPNTTQILALVWLLINIALQVVTALLGLTYSTDVSSDYVFLTYGNVSVADVSYVGNAETAALYAGDYSSLDAYLAELSAANDFGVTGQDFSVWTASFDEYFSYDQSVYTDGDVCWYRFVDRSPLAWSLSAITYRTVNITAACQTHPVTFGGYAGFNTNDTSLKPVVTWMDANGEENTWTIPAQSTGGTTWMSNFTSDCGPRCTQTYALQVADNITTDVPTPRFWSCFSNVSTVDGIDQHPDLYPDPAWYRIPDEQARILAGAIGWSGVRTVENASDLTFATPESQLQMVSYQADSPWSPPSSYTADDMAWLVMRFTAGAISAMDAVGPRSNVTAWGPAAAQIIHVQWRFAASILGGIPLAQGLVLLIVIMFANKAIIKDTSHLSTARLLRPVVKKLGDRGCLLTGDEIAEQLGNYKIIYGVREPNAGFGGGIGVGVGIVGTEDDKIKHLDILEESEGLGYRHGRMPEGRYDGMYPAQDEQTAALLANTTESEPDSDDGPRAPPPWSDLRESKRRTRRMSI